MATDPFRLAEEAAESLRSRFNGAQPDVAVVLGSGWGPAADVLGDPLAEFPAEEMAGYIVRYGQAVATDFCSMTKDAKRSVAGFTR